jgi:rhamnose utilization protein RhaD (predicted bifunctional aldolase and dehydrogenase)
MSMKELVAVSRRYGSDPDFVVAGGGNTSWKTASELFVKASGSALESIDESGFVRLKRVKLAAVWTATYPEDPEARESAILAELMAARFPSEAAKRPSVETLLHDILPQTFVVHTHPALVNGIACSAEGESAAARLFGEEALWIPSTNPGYILSKIVKEASQAYRARTGREPGFILLQNHGIFVAADSIEDIDAIYGRVMSRIGQAIARKPDFSGRVDEYGDSAAIAARLAELAAQEGVPACIAFRRNAELARLVADASAFAPLASAYTPDHIVYAGSDPLFVGSDGDIEAAWKRFIGEKKRKPKILALSGCGVFGIGNNGISARLAIELFQDAAKVAAYVESFGGPRFMSRDQIDFINTWEVERYRSKISTKS